ncbi:hypothetical protein Q4601_09130 [Shewanella sp. 1_MG-2023]|uniref:hypothetical protein n=1 Tax=unclassified Shewanella TaxID=196818 RepID=UPI0026E1C41E|nr:MULTISPECIES: hypothetical protein [unclassified Shewanella]MDO6612423.1 hypothetical protein [Shewanella sp. 7_MG-2023]MDO6772536.1 hypothetical protein [Shewanella sp. 2_MG-2023]MDO6794467.1 hypothetical protein [Shewanella sp. 1_MG-2023]
MLQALSSIIEKVILSKETARVDFELDNSDLDNSDRKNNGLEKNVPVNKERTDKEPAEKDRDTVFMGSIPIANTTL